MRIAADWLTDADVRRIMAMFADAGHRAWFVGGCVRNAVIGAGATDVDITTDALPERVLALAGAAGLRAVPTGIDHGTVTLVAGGRPHEVTTLRRDVETRGRHATVAFGTSLEQDAARRDFTMNALYATGAGEVLDPLGLGLDDLRAGRVRFIGDAGARIAEDYLRILRFFRFHAWYGDPEGGIDAEGLAACAGGLDGIALLSRERIGAEMRKLLAAPDPAPAVGAMAASGVLLRVLPGAGVQTLAVLVHVEGAAGLAPDWLRRLAALGGEGAADALRLSRAEARRLARLRDAMAGGLDAAGTGYRLGATDATDALALRAAMAGREIAPGALQAAAEGAMRVFPLRAHDLPPDLHGARIGAALARAEAQWITEGFTPDRDALLAWLAGAGAKPDRSG
ncbi:MAG: CCA tRNA nucleotidyltransferase [Rubellimicrobium sp.]|nr:CCA tRNA nucleotidyltransferase [Rubellimicrobium sp.]